MTRRMVPQCQDFLDALKPLSRATEVALLQLQRNLCARPERPEPRAKSWEHTKASLSDAIPAVAEDQRQSDLVLAAI